jgi:hypothetical protein
MMTYIKLWILDLSAGWVVVSGCFHAPHTFTLGIDPLAPLKYFAFAGNQALTIQLVLSYVSDLCLLKKAAYYPDYLFHTRFPYIQL